MTVKHGIRCTALQDAMTNIGIQIDGFKGPGWRIVNVMEKLDEQVYHDVVETALGDFETLKGQIETRTALLKLCNVHMKDLIGAISHLPNAISPLRRPEDDDLENMVRWMPDYLDNLEDIKCRMKTMETALSTILERLHAMQVIRNAKEDQKLSEANKGKGDN